MLSLACNQHNPFVAVKSVDVLQRSVQQYIPIDLDNLYNAAMEAHAVPCCISVNIGAVDEKHFKAGVVLHGDKCRFRVNAFDRFEK